MSGVMIIALSVDSTFRAFVERRRQRLAQITILYTIIITIAITITNTITIISTIIMTIYQPRFSFKAAQRPPQCPCYL